MLIVVILLLSVLLTASVIGNVFLFNSAEAWRSLNQVNEKRLVDIKGLVQQVYEDMKAIDSREWFQKDDEVGVVFEELVDITKWFNDIVQNEEDVELSGEIEKE